ATCLLFIFFVQAEDGIRARNVTGVQTCALPIFRKIPAEEPVFYAICRKSAPARSAAYNRKLPHRGNFHKKRALCPCFLYPVPAKIGRASCRERMNISSNSK